MPAGLTATKPGSTLHFGQTATVGYAPNPSKSTALQLTVSRVVRQPITVLRSYQLDPAAASSTPYFVTVTVRNRGHGDLGGSAVPLWAVDRANTLIQTTSFTNRFKACPSKALPAGFTNSKSVRTCLVYLVPAHQALTAVSFRPLQAVAPITWTGTIAHPKRHVPSQGHGRSHHHK